ncbi:MAG: DUF4331 domain-containing protein [Gemmatimonadaceae bacterium]|jgi:hypothetical protein|nr:DUF4331 domain-containing protein [Gemmatimonadaceae bacterium]
MRAIPSPARRRLRIAIAVMTATALVAGVAVASDHQDTPEVELSPRSDINDVYAFPGSTPDRTVLAVTTSSPIAGGSNGAAAFDPNLLYQIKIDNTGDGVEDRVLQFTVRGEGTAQQVELRGPVAPAVTGIRTRLVPGAPVLRGPINRVLTGDNGVQLFAGLRDDPFFIDLEQFFRIIPDRKPVSGALSRLPETPTATAWRPAGQAVDFLRGFNALAFVVELPTALLTQGGTPRLGVWATISR